MTCRPDRLPRVSPAARERLAAAAEGKDGLYLLEGPKQVADALALARVPVREVWLADDLPPGAADGILSVAARRGVPAGLLARRDVEKASGTVSPQGVLALVSDVAVDPAEAVRAAEGPVILLDRVQDPGNVGAIFRSAAAFGAGAVLVAEGSADPLRLKALRASAGTVLSVPYARGPLDALIGAIRAAGLPLWLLDGRGTDLFATKDRPRAFALAVGSEGSGASDALRAASDSLLSIPISASVESLNAAVALGVALSHLLRLPVAGAAPRVRPKPR